MKTATLIALPLTMGLALSACKQDETTDVSPTTPAPSAMMAEAAKQAEIDAKAAALPKPDLTRPLSAYPELDSGKQVMFLYLAASKLPPDYEKVASAYSSDYRETRDSFRKHDLLEAIRPQLDAEIASARKSPYAWMAIDDSGVLGGYDFERGGFPVDEFAERRMRYFYDNSDYKLTWANADAVAFAPVKDEAVARRIEQMRTDYGNKPQLKVYFFAQSADMDQRLVNAYVIRVQVVDRNGLVLAEYGPQPVAGG